MSCFRGTLGNPDYVSFELVDRDWMVAAAEWYDYGVYVYDSTNARGDYGPDGRIDYLYLYGSTAEL